LTEWIQDAIAPLSEIDPAELYERPATSKDPAKPSKLRLKPLNEISPLGRKAIHRIRLEAPQASP
jgi:hypothetical protein